MKLGPIFWGGCVLLAACNGSSGADYTLYGTIYDGVPEVIFNDPAGVEAHTLPDATLDILDISGALSAEEWTAYRLLEPQNADENGDFTISDPALEADMPLQFRVEAPGHAPTLFAGTLPAVSTQNPYFAFYTGALFSEDWQAYGERLRFLDPKAAIPDPEIEGQGGILYGQVLSEPQGGQALPLEGVTFTLERWDGQGWVIGPSIHYLNDGVEVDEKLTETSTSGVFYALEIPPGIIRLQARRGAESYPPFRTLALEDGLTWMAGFHLR